MMFRRDLIALAASGLVAQAHAASAATPLSPGGTRLQQYLDRLQVEANWIAGHRIVWETGQQDGPDGVGPEDHTHCSAFVAAAALGLDIYILRPPHHRQELLANAQALWLAGSTAYQGPTAAAEHWTNLGKSSGATTLADAVRAANAGKLVVAAYAEPDAHKPGHAAIVRPQSAAYPAESGPLVMMAGTHNWQSIAMRNAFAGHPGAWPGGIGLFVHDTVLEKQYTAANGLG
jgi:hypothetical protein